MSVRLWLHRTLHSLETENVAFKKKKILYLQNFSTIPQKKPLQTPKVCLELRGNESADLTHAGNAYPILVKHATHRCLQTHSMFSWWCLNSPH